MAELPTQVECYAGQTYPERPLAFWWQGQRLAVSAVRREARLPEGRRFLVESGDERIFELTYLAERDEWQVREVS
jgi:hypothetical protein